MTPNNRRAVVLDMMPPPGLLGKPSKAKKKKDPEDEKDLEDDVDEDDTGNRIKIELEFLLPDLLKAR
jgi:hypothetical protein